MGMNDAMLHEKLLALEGPFGCLAEIAEGHIVKHSLEHLPRDCAVVAN